MILCICLLKNIMWLKEKGKFMLLSFCLNIVANIIAIIALINVLLKIYHNN